MKKLLTFNWGLLLLVFLSTVCSAKNIGKKIKEQTDSTKYTGYLFAYFEDSGAVLAREQLRFGISTDAVNWKALNHNLPIIGSDSISVSGGIRDPHILRGEDGKTFYIVATDMLVAKNGWKANPGIVLLKSSDLIHWTHAYINLSESYPKDFGDAFWVWAPQTIYDSDKGKYMIYFTLKRNESKDLITYYAYANEDFTAFESTPKKLFNAKYGSIDNDIIYKDGEWHLFYKGNTKDIEGNEIQNGIQQATSKKLTKGWKENFIYLDAYADKKTTVEGSSIFKLNNSDTYVLMYDLYSSHRYEYQTSNDLYKFTSEPKSFTKDFNPRHGSIISLTQDEMDRLIQKWGNTQVQRNPVIKGLYADPEVLYSHQTGKYYIYPTSDGYDNWGGYSFKVFSSDNLVDWKDEGIILDLKTDVSWADKNAWAPCIIEKKINGGYKYYYYFTAAQKIGVAVSDSPTGPFVDSGKPLVDQRPEGIKRGSVIDPDVFEDPISGKTYLYYGNGFFVAVELNEDMVSVKPETQQVIRVDATYREGSYVFFRNGIYYFLWSEDDTRSEDYRVRYATSTSPTGPLSIPENNLILAKDSSVGIYGTGHNSVLQIPGKDEWYIVYHRFNYPNGITMGRAAGYNREVCIDRLEFNEDGSIKPVKPTL